MSELRVGVLGAGVVGLSTALELQRRHRNARVDVVADAFAASTTSHVAAGLFRPGTSFAGPTEEVARKWINDSFHFWDELAHSSEGAKAGVAHISGYIFSSQFPNIVRNHYIEKLVPVYREATEDELKICPGNWKYGSFFTTTVTECGLYLPWASQKFLEAGGIITKQKIDCLNEIAEKYDVVVNCTGFGAKYLCNDNKLVPIRGQVLKVKAPWIKTFFYGDYDTYIIPGFEAVTLGGCRQYDSYDLKINKYVGLDIKERCENLVPSLKGAELVAQRVGLRPHRDPVRVEKEFRTTPNGIRVKIVHNYGHGGYGVTCAPGTAMYASDLVRDVLVGNSRI